MGLTESDMSVDEEWIVDLTRSLGNGSRGVECEVDMSSTDDSVEGKLCIQLMAQFGSLVNWWFSSLVKQIHPTLLWQGRNINGSCYFEEFLDIYMKRMCCFVLKRDEYMKVIAVLLIVDAMDSLFEGFLKEFLCLTEDKFVWYSDIKFLMFFINADDRTFIQKGADDLGIVVKRKMLHYFSPDLTEGAYLFGCICVVSVKKHSRKS